MHHTLRPRWRPHGRRVGVLAALAIALFGAFLLSTTARAVSPPVISSISPNVGPASGGTPVLITGTGFTNATSVHFGALPATFTSSTNPQSVDSRIIAYAPPQAAGTVDVTVTTPLGTSSITIADKFTYTGAPVVTSVSPSGGPTSGGTSVTVTGAGFTNTTSVLFGGTPTGAFSVITDTLMTVVSPSHAAGLVHIQVVTPAGTSAPTSADLFSYAGAGAPIVTGISPASGPPSGGTVVTISGGGFSGAVAVTFGGTLASFSIVNDGMITAIAPAHSAGTFDVLVSNGLFTSPATAADLFTYVIAPIITGIVPSSGPVAGGTLVTITGAGFTGVSLVTFGSSVATITGATDTVLTVISPPHAAGTVDIRVTTPLGTSFPSAADLFTYTGGPFVSNVSPASGPTSGGTNVTISGAGFTGATSVAFGATGASFTVLSDTQIVAVSPAHTAGTVDVRVTTPAGTSAATAADLFLYTGGPVITGLSPSSGSTAGGTAVVISGAGFTGATSVTFGGVAASFVVVSDTRINATAPAHAAGTVDVLVTTPAGTSGTTTADNFTYSGTTVTYTLSFRWTLIVWRGPDGMSIATALLGTGGSGNVTLQVTAVDRWNATTQDWESYFPGTDSVPGANDFTTFSANTAYFIAITGPGSVTLTVPAG